jgi:hypothetical protein
MSFVRKIKKGGKVYLAEIENRRVGGKVVQRFIRYVGKEADGRTVLSASMSDVEVEEVKLFPRPRSICDGTIGDGWKASSQQPEAKRFKILRGKGRGLFHLPLFPAWLAVDRALALRRNRFFGRIPMPLKSGMTACMVRQFIWREKVAVSARAVGSKLRGCRIRSSSVARISRT